MENQQNSTIHKNFWALWVAFLVIKLGVAYWFPFVSDEMYYWVWAKHPSLSYFDHPPFVAWLTTLGLPLEDFGFALRWPAVLFGHISILIWREVIKPFLSERELLWWALLFFFSPVTGIGSIIVTPDVPLMVLWPTAIWCFQKWTNQRSLKWAAAFGLAMGVGFCAKYHIVILGLAVLLILITRPEWIKPALKQASIVGLFFLIGALPVILWNWNHDWASFRFQLTRGLGKPMGTDWVIDYLGAQIALIFPTILFLALTSSKSTTSRILKLLAWTPLVFFLVSSLKGRVEPNWTSVALPAIFALAVVGLRRKALLSATISLWVAFLVALGIQYQFKVLPVANSDLKLGEYSAFDSYLPFVEQYKPLYVSSYQIASTLYWKTRVPTFKLRGLHRPDHFDLMPESFPKEPEFYVLRSAWNDLPQWLLDSYNYEYALSGLPNDMLILRVWKK